MWAVSDMPTLHWRMDRQEWVITNPAGREIWSGDEMCVAASQKYRIHRLFRQWRILARGGPARERLLRREGKVS